VGKASPDGCENLDNTRQDKNQRHSIRLKGYDYSEAGAYFLTVCTKTKVSYFEMYPELKNILRTEWELLPERFLDMVPDSFVIMPNHIHALIILRKHANNVGATLAVAQRAGASPAPTIGKIVGAYKSLCVNKWIKLIRQSGLNLPGTIWQRNYYEHVIRSEEALNRVREYIIFNQLSWHLDAENPNHVDDKEYSNKWRWLESGISDPFSFKDELKSGSK
jgi:putative transposase